MTAASSTHVRAAPKWPSPLAQRAAAEAIGTFALVFAGCGAIAVDSLTGVIGHGGISATFGLTVTVMVYAVGHVSGAHFNPAVSIAFAAGGELPWREVPVYVAIQTLAAIAASGALQLLLGPGVALGTTTPSGSSFQSLGFEAVATFFLMFVIAAVATDERSSPQTAPLAIGGAVTVGALFAGPISGGSMNPARTLGPALWSNTTDALWIYVVGPVLGAVIGRLAYRAVR